PHPSGENPTAGGEQDSHAEQDGTKPPGAARWAGKNTLMPQEPPEVGGEIARPDVPLVRVLAETLQTDVLQVRGHLRLERGRVHGRGRAPLCEGAEQAPPPEGGPAGEPPVKSRPEPVHTRDGGTPPRRLFGGHVARRPSDRTGGGFAPVEVPGQSE